MQDPRLAKECVDAQGRPNPSGVNNLVMGRPTGVNGAVLFGHFTDGDPVPVMAAEAVWHLIAQLYFGPSGQCTPRRIAGRRDGRLPPSPCAHAAHRRTCSAPAAPRATSTRSPPPTKAAPTCPPATGKSPGQGQRELGPGRTYHRVARPDARHGPRPLPRDRLTAPTLAARQGAPHPTVFGKRGTSPTKEALHAAA
ncbi:hypothetical protein LMU33_25245 [Streptomyces sp. JA03]|nr:hypothetical protein [Streptomyces barringtoniae]MCC5478381.1 hypothetical protein [Streptomyces barringtoniae]